MDNEYYKVYDSKLKKYWKTKKKQFWATKLGAKNAWNIRRCYSACDISAEFDKQTRFVIHLYGKS